jgi:hypothetical protein
MDDLLRLNESLSVLEERYVELHTSLNPVLSDPAPQCEQEQGIPSNPSCQVMEALQLAHLSVKNLTDGIDGLLSRLCV